MSKKPDKKKALSPAQAKLLEDLASLSKAYKQACKRQGLAAYAPFLQSISVCTENIQPVTKVACHGPGLDATTVTTVLDIIKGDSACKALLVTDCLLGDHGLSYISSLLSHSCGKWWTGPKLTLLEITFERRPAKVSADKPSCSSRDGPHSAFSTNSPTALAVATGSTSRTSSLPQPLAAPSGNASRAASLQQPLDRLTPVAVPNDKPTEQTFPLGNPVSPAAPAVLAPAQAAKQQQQIAAVQQAPKGPPKQRKTKGAVPPATPEPSAAQALQQHLQQYRSSMQAVQAPHLTLARLPLPYAACCLTQPGLQFIPGFQATALDPSTTLPGLSNIRNTDVAVAAASQLEAEMWRCTTWGQVTESKVKCGGANVDPSAIAGRPRASLGDPPGGMADFTGSLGGQQGSPEGPHCFSLDAIRTLGVALGTPGLQLSILTLSFIGLGTAAVKVLCEGLVKCRSLQQLTLSSCNMGPQCAMHVCEAITPHELRPGKGTSQPKLTHLDLQGNPLGGQGLLDLCQGIASCVTLTHVNLKAVGVCHQDTDALRTFANVMSCHPALQDVNLDGNLIGDVGASMLLTAIQAKTAIYNLRITRYISRSFMQQLVEQLASNAKAHLAKKKKSPRKKASK